MKKDNTASWHSTRPHLMLVYLSIRLGSFPSKTQEVILYHVNEFGNIHSLTTLLEKKNINGSIIKITTNIKGKRIG
jgi:hypothetical protein